MKVQSPAVTASGDSLSLREGGAALREEFMDTTLSADLSKLLDPSLPSWRAWEASLDYTAKDDEAIETWLQEFNDWSAQVAEKQAERTARKNAEAEATEEAAKAGAEAEGAAQAG